MLFSAYIDQSLKKTFPCFPDSHSEEFPFEEMLDPAQTD